MKKGEIRMKMYEVFFARVRYDSEGNIAIKPEDWTTLEQHGNINNALSDIKNEMELDEFDYAYMIVRKGKLE